MTLTSSGNLGINSTTPSSKLSIVGDAYITGITTITDGLKVGNFIANSASSGNGSVGIFTDIPEYSIQIGRNPLSSSGVGISSTGNVIVSGITTSSGGFTSGSGGPVQISVVGSTLTFTVPGVGSTTLTLS